MCEKPFITSLQNESLKEVVRLRDRRHRDQCGRFLVEGYRELLRLAEAGRSVEKLFFCRELFLGSHEPALIDRLVALGAELFPCAPRAFEKISYRDRPDGLLAIAPLWRQGLESLESLLSEVKEPPFLIVAEAIEKPGNLGTILRSSDAVGVHALILCDGCTDLFNPNVVRASVGTLFTVPTFEAGSNELLAFLKGRGISIMAATPAAEKEFTQVDLTGPVALAVGTEQLGLSSSWMNQADVQVKIPMRGKADSLNVAMATGLLLYEVLRQRSQAIS